MEIRAYSELYVESAQNILGHMFDFAINEANFSPRDIASRFCMAPCSKQFEIGNPRYVAGMTGPELAKVVLKESGYKKELPEDVMYIDRSPEYWAGWSLAYYQWLRDYKFSDILSAIGIDYILKLYPVYHEMDILKFVSLADEKMKEAYPDTALKRYRTNAGLSQSELAEESGVPLRQIQMFEQRQRDINKTSAINLLKLSKVLHIRMEDLMERGDA
ncbi:helix-turn-helix domain-containing protein [Butyrivibrio sp. YAB3001]|uniref:helix-turn-helix domain-containing protein n=1 Tax=Butyrivibrio sp. YAB3001 TaxID=1520812 RepID=UPI0008F621B8|nr:helix-turn-helix transcriptional regulator [Butyrivibrio sp. YAB3001]SFB71667.1 Helix-turn-helix [Butyrivibrio sp. YAB3001]